MVSKQRFLELVYICILFACAPQPAGTLQEPRAHLCKGHSLTSTAYFTLYPPATWHLHLFSICIHLHAGWRALNTDELHSACCQTSDQGL